jgi:tetratricopeptide (TPR) repeat protein
MMTLARTLQEFTKYQEAETVLANVLTMSLDDNRDSFLSISVHGSLAALHHRQGWYHNAKHSYRHVINLAVRAHTDSHQTSPVDEFNLAVILNDLGRHKEAEKLYS